MPHKDNIARAAFRAYAGATWWCVYCVELTAWYKYLEHLVAAVRLYVPDNIRGVPKQLRYR
jgi:hypothetical protein